MSFSLALAFLFFVGAICGWGIEFLFRNLISHKGPRGEYFINPGFCSGPWLPIYGLGISIMFLISAFFATHVNAVSVGGKILVILGIAAAMTLLELAGGLFLLKFLNLRLWDYRDRPGNFMGVICPLFTVIWGIIGALYYLVVHPYAINGVYWLSRNLAFSFFVGLFFGVFIIDLITSAQRAAVIKQFGDDHEVVVKFEELKSLMMAKMKEEKGKQKFFNQAKETDVCMEETLKKHAGALEAKAEAFKSRRKRSEKR